MTISKKTETDAGDSIYDDDSDDNDDDDDDDDIVSQPGGDRDNKKLEELTRALRCQYK